MSSQRYQANYDLLTAQDPLTALRLGAVHQNHLHLLETAKNVQNIHWKYGKQDFFLHDEDVPEEEIRQYLSEYSLANVEVIYFFGIGLGYSWPLLQKWLDKKPERRLVYLEDDLGVLKLFLETDIATEILSHPRVQIAVFHKIEEEKSTFNNLTWQHLLKEILVLSLPSYSDHRKEVAQLLVERLTFESANKNRIVSEFLDHGVVFYRNFYANLKQLHRCYHGNRLFNRFFRVPAIICGAGPSINGQLELIRELQNRAIILAGGSAINVLNGVGINPHFGGGIDPNIDQYLRYRQNEAYEVPFFFRPRLQSDAFLVIDGPKLYINGSGGYETAKWFDEKLDIGADEIDEGHNIVNFLVNIAVHLGCDPIIIVGMDLAYTKLEAYASHVVDSPQVEKEEIVSTGNFETGAILKEDIYGHPTYTMWKWIAESQWISRLAKEYSHITFINATEGGLGFEGVDNKPLREVVESYLDCQYDFDGMIHQEIQGAALTQVTKEKVYDLMMELKASMKRAITHLETLVEESQTAADKASHGEEIPEEGLTGLGILAELDLKDEPAYEAVLAIFEKVKRHHLGEKANDLHEQVHLWTFLLETALLNLQMIEDCYER